MLGQKLRYPEPMVRPRCRHGWIMLLLSACASAAPPMAPNPRPQVLPELHISALAPEALPSLLEEANDRFLRDEFATAASDFDRIVAADPNGPTATPSLYNAALAYLALGDHEKALARFRLGLERFPTAETTKPALLRIARILAQLERWQELEEVAVRVIERGDLSLLERIEVLGARGLALVSMGKPDEAHKDLILARNLIEDNKIGIAGPPPLELAQVSFALGEVRRMRSEKIVFVPMPADFAMQLENRCTGLLDAQEAYTEAMRSRDSHWSAMSGYRIGRLYQQLHRDVMKVDPPASFASVKQRQLWEGAMRLRYRVLLEKGLKMVEGTVRMGERTGEASSWIARAREAQRELELALADEKAALEKMPFREDEMRAALEKLKKK